MDDAIVDVENVWKHLRENRLLPEGERKSVIEVVFNASKEVRMPIYPATSQDSTLGSRRHTPHTRNLQTAHTWRYAIQSAGDSRQYYAGTASIGTDTIGLDSAG